MIRIEWATPSESAQADAAAELLSSAEIERMLRFRQQADRDRFLVAWSMARRVLGEVTGSDPRSLAFDRRCDHCGDPLHGKPKLTAGGPDFSLSHADDRVVLAVTDTGRVGVDVESVARHIDELARMILAPGEPVVSGVDLLKVWVRKEALIKASGHGLARPMEGVDLGALPVGESVSDLPADAGYVAAFAVLSAPPFDL